MLWGGEALVGGVEHQPQRLFQVTLAAEVLQSFGAEVPRVPTMRVLARNGIVCLGAHKDIPPIWIRCKKLVHRSLKRLIGQVRSFLERE